MEEYVWSDPRVLSRLRENVVLISLYVDERTKLPESEQGVSEETGRKIKNIGNKWSEFQEVNFGAVAQPYYVFLGHDSLEPLHESAAYDPDIEKFIDWLDRGVEAFEAQK
jgi:thiol:disulfide interchange protein DsbD